MGGEHVNQLTEEQRDERHGAALVCGRTEDIECVSDVRVVPALCVTRRKTREHPMARARDDERPGRGHERDGETPSLLARRTNASRRAVSACRTFLPSGVR